MHKRNIKGQYSGKSRKGIIVLVGTIVAIGVTLYLSGDNSPSTGITGPVATSTERVAESDPRIRAYLDREDVKKAQELDARMAIYEQDRLDELARYSKVASTTESDYATEKAEMEARYAERRKVEKTENAERMLRVNGKLESARKEQMDLASSTGITVKGR